MLKTSLYVSLNRHMAQGISLLLDKGVWLGFRSFKLFPESFRNDRISLWIELEPVL